MRAARGLPSLRGDLAFRLVRGALRDTRRVAFRVVHFSVQRDHVHLLVEATDGASLSSGMRGLAVRVARRLNRALGRRGAVWGDRWNGRALRSPREVRNALAYVLFNGHKHGDVQFGVDPCSSIYWSGLSLADPAYAALGELSGARDPPVSSPRTWLLRVGWQRHGLLRMRDIPRPARRQRDC
jgi:REP element-mobilizing transposase RayT